MRGNLAETKKSKSRTHAVGFNYETYDEINQSRTLIFTSLLSLILALA